MSQAHISPKNNLWTPWFSDQTYFYHFVTISCPWSNQCSCGPPCWCSLARGWGWMGQTTQSPTTHRCSHKTSSQQHLTAIHSWPTSHTVKWSREQKGLHHPDKSAHLYTTKHNGDHHWLLLRKDLRVLWPAFSASQLSQCHTFRGLHLLLGAVTMVTDSTFFVNTKYMYVCIDLSTCTLILIY